MKASPFSQIAIIICFVTILFACKKDKHQPSDDFTVTTLTAYLKGPHGIATDLQGNLYVTEFAGYRIRKITPTGTVSTLAGNGRPGYIDGNDTSAQFTETYGIATDAQGNVFVTDQRNDRIRNYSYGQRHHFCPDSSSIWSSN